MSIGPWTVSSSKTVLRDKWISVRADDCRTAEGALIAPFYILEYPDWVQIVAIDDEDHILLVEQYRHGLGSISLELPAGGVESTDTDALDAAARELCEETGYVATEWRYLGALSPNTANHTNRAHIALALGARFQHSPKDDPTERMNVLRLPIKEVVRRALAGEIVQATHVASLAIALSAVQKWPL